LSGSCFLEGDEATGELEEREVVGGFLRPADQERAVAVEPGVAGLDDPAACPPAGRADLVADLVGATAYVGRRETVGGDKFADPRIVVAAVEAESRWLLRFRLGPLDRDRVERRR
jgi:hypothetical protein